jgi:hypothetical protein
MFYRHNTLACTSVGLPPKCLYLFLMSGAVPASANILRLIAFVHVSYRWMKIAVCIVSCSKHVEAVWIRGTFFWITSIQYSSISELSAAIGNLSVIWKYVLSHIVEAKMYNFFLIWNFLSSLYAQKKSVCLFPLIPVWYFTKYISRSSARTGWIRIPFLTVPRDFPLPQNVQTNSGATHSHIQWALGALSPEVKQPGRKLTTYLWLVTRIRMIGVTLIFHLYDFMAWTGTSVPWFRIVPLWYSQELLIGPCVEPDECNQHCHILFYSYPVRDSIKIAATVTACKLHPEEYESTELQVSCHVLQTVRHLLFWKHCIQFFCVLRCEGDSSVN